MQLNFLKRGQMSGGAFGFLLTGVIFILVLGLVLGISARTNQSFADQATAGSTEASVYANVSSAQATFASNVGLITTVIIGVGILLLVALIIVAVRGGVRL